METMYLIDKSLTLDPEKKNPFSKSRFVFCRGCFEEIKDKDLDKVFKISFGMAIDDVFFPEKRNYYYHVDCLQGKRK